MHPAAGTLQEWLASALEARHVRITAMEKLAGGAIQENWALDVVIDGGPHAGSHHWVLRTDAPSVISTSHDRTTEFALLEVAHKAGMTVPEPVIRCPSPEIIGAAFFIMSRAAGTAQARKIVRDPDLVTYGAALAEDLGVQMARLHKIRPPVASLDMLPAPPANPATARIAGYRRDLDAMDSSHPVLEYALNWLEDRRPPPPPPVLCHCDLRTGNYMVDNGKLTAILDWEFAGWSDPMEDIGWITARCWRFGNAHLPVGGIGSLDAFLRGYETEAGHPVDRDGIRYWQVMAEVRWAVIALQQAARSASGAEISLELALSGQLVPEMEWNMLDLMGEEDAP